MKTKTLVKTEITKLFGNISSKIDFYYKSDERIDYVKGYEWNEQKREWSFNYWNVYVYNRNEQLYSIETKYYSSHTIFYIGYKEEFQYDDRGYLKSKIIYNFDHNTKKLQPFLKHDYQYDVNGKLVEELVYNYISGSWTKNNKLEFAHDDNGKLTILIQYNYESGYSGDYDWERNIKKTYTYNSKGQLELKQIRIFSAKEYPNPSEEEEYTYNECGQLEKSERKEWNSFANKWNRLNDIEYIY